MVKKRGAKRRPWNKGLEVGKKGAFAPAQVKRIRQVLLARGVSGLRNLALFLLGHAKIESTARFLRVPTTSDPIAISRAFDI